MPLNNPHAYFTHNEGDIQMSNPMNPHIKPKGGNIPAKGLHGTAITPKQPSMGGGMSAKFQALAKMRKQSY